MTNHDIAKLLRDVATAMSIKNGKDFYFEILAYQRAADIIDSHPVELADLFKEGKLCAVPGIGATIKEHLIELLGSGRAKHFDDVRDGIPPSVFRLTDVPTIGPKTAYVLASSFKLDNPTTVIADVARLAREGQIAALPGFGTKSQANILRAVTEYTQRKGQPRRMPLPYAMEVAQQLIDYFKGSADVIEAYPLGSLRRMKETIGDIDIAVATRYPDRVLDYFLSYRYRARTIERGPVTASMILNSGTQIDLMVQPPESFGSLLQHFTGSRAHNIHLREVAQKKDLSLSEYGIKHLANGKTTQFTTEEAFYGALGLQWMPPEMREDTGEIELAVEHRLPTLVTLEDIKGDLHLHSNYPVEPSHDTGKDTMGAMIQKALERGYEYLGFAEHNPSLSQHSAEQVRRILERRTQQIESLRWTGKGIHVVNLLEVDILPDGRLAIDEEAASTLDAMIVSVHSAWRMKEGDMTRRVLEGLNHPKAKILAHPTGRLLNVRPGYKVDWDRVFDFVKTHNKALEINSWPNRLDLPDALVRIAVEQGIKMVIDTDSHAAGQMDLMKYGIAVARRGWATAGDIVNTLTYAPFVEWLHS